MIIMHNAEYSKGSQVRYALRRFVAFAMAGAFALCVLVVRPISSVGAPQGSAKADVASGLRFLKGDHAPKNYALARHYFQIAAAQHDAMGQAYLGDMYKAGEGVPRNYATALRWYRLSASGKSGYGEARLGDMYEAGEGVPRDYAAAVRWYRLSAAQGNGYGANDLGEMYAAGYGVPQDYPTALHWLQLSLGRSGGSGENALGFMYFNGNGVVKDVAKAYHFFLESASQGSPGGADNVGYMYEHGLGVTRDDALAADWFRKSATQGYADGELDLGYMYQDGRGVPQSDARALHYLRASAAQGNAKAKRYLATIASKPKPLRRGELQAFASSVSTLVLKAIGQASSNFADYHPVLTDREYGKTFYNVQFTSSPYVDSCDIDFIQGFKDAVFYGRTHASRWGLSCRSHTYGNGANDLLHAAVLATGEALPSGFVRIAVKDPNTVDWKNARAMVEVRLVTVENHRFRDPIGTHLIVFVTHIDQR